MSSATPPPLLRRLPDSADADVNALLDAARVPLSVSAAAAALALGGLMVGLVGAQNLTLVTWVGIWATVPWAMLAVGVASVAVASKLMHARGWTLVPAMALSILLALARGRLLHAGVGGRDVHAAERARRRRRGGGHRASAPSPSGRCGASLPRGGASSRLASISTCRRARGGRRQSVCR